MAKRTVSNAMDAAAEAMADRIEPLMLDTMVRTERLNIEFDQGQWDTLMYALTDKLPLHLRKLPISKDDRLELLTVIDAIDRTLQAKGSTETARMLLRSMVSMSDLLGTFRHAIKLRITEDGNDITDDIFS